jgi:hypothetical protein
MAFSATCKAGLVPYRMSIPGERIHVAGDPGVTFTRDCLYTIPSTTGVAIAVTDSLANGALRCCKTMVCPAATTPFPPNANKYAGFNPSDANLATLIPMEFLAPEQMIYAARIANFSDETVVTYSAATHYIGETTGHGTDDYANGALIYVYAGTGMGEINIVEDYDHTGGTPELKLFTHRQFTATLDTTSKFIVLAGSASANTVGPGSTMDPYDLNDLDVIDGYDDGDFMVYPSWRDICALLPTGALPVIRRITHE